jgi:hypothetical protein
MEKVSFNKIPMRNTGAKQLEQKGHSPLEVAGQDGKCHRKGEMVFERRE